MISIKQGVIEFLCEEKDFGIIPKPIPSRHLIPEWFKKLPGKIDGKETLNNSTIKRCPPFLDAMTMGSIIPLVADVSFSTNEDASQVQWNHNFYKSVVESHSWKQITSPKAPNPVDPLPPIKFLNYWMIKVPKGYSVMFMPPLNRPDPRFYCLSGVVECDKYWEYINFPGFITQPNFQGIIPAGTPLVQCIAFKRDSVLRGEKISKLSAEDLKRRQKTRDKRASHESYYRDQLWERK